MVRILLILIALLLALAAQSQPSDSLVIRKIFSYCLEEGKSYELSLIHISEPTRPY